MVRGIAGVHRGGTMISGITGVPSPGAGFGFFLGNIILTDGRQWWVILLGESVFRWIESVLATATDHTSSNIISRDYSWFGN
jgi:hypothetical protein